MEMKVPGIPCRWGLSAALRVSPTPSLRVAVNLSDLSPHGMNWLWGLPSRLFWPSSLWWLDEVRPIFSLCSGHCGQHSGDWGWLMGKRGSYSLERIGAILPVLPSPGEDLKLWSKRQVPIGLLGNLPPWPLPWALSQAFAATSSLPGHQASLRLLGARLAPGVLWACSVPASGRKHLVKGLHEVPRACLLPQTHCTSNLTLLSLPVHAPSPSLGHQFSKGQCDHALPAPALPSCPLSPGRG